MMYQSHCGHVIVCKQEGVGAPVLTDDVSLQVFMDHLKKLAVSSSTQMLCDFYEILIVNILLSFIIINNY